MCGVAFRTTAYAGAQTWASFLNRNWWRTTQTMGLRNPGRLMIAAVIRSPDGSSSTGSLLAGATGKTGEVQRGKGKGRVD